VTKNNTSSQPQGSPASKPLRVGLISLGCAKNLVDAEIMLGSLLRGGVVKVSVREN
jgi:tRNA A37 methylthiotransferase MiaB